MDLATSNNAESPNSKETKEVLQDGTVCLSHELYHHPSPLRNQRCTATEVQSFRIHWLV